jgi:hypothetical protein
MIVVRYEIRSAVSFLPIIHRFSTQAAARNFIDRFIPAEAKNLSIWVEEDEEPRQQPTYAGRREPRNRWWDENKRPFRDTYELQGEQA